jgi:hypothetical protein
LTITVDQLVAKDLSNAVVLQKWVENIQLTGTFSERRPDLGKMFKCGGCGRRHRMIGPKCSNVRYATTQRAWTPEEGFHQQEVPERVNEQMFGHATLRRIMHKRHGQTRTRYIAQHITKLQNDSEALAAAVKQYQEFYPHTKAPTLAEIPKFGRMHYLWLQAVKVRYEKKQRDVSRRINRGHAKPGSRA